VGHSKRRRFKCRQPASSNKADGKDACGSLTATGPGSVCTGFARRSCDILVATATAEHTVLACICLQHNMPCTERKLSGQNWPGRRTVRVFRRNDSDSKARAGPLSLGYDNRGMRIFLTGEDHVRIGILKNAHSGPHNCISQSAFQIQTDLAVSLQSPLSSPVTLELHMQWNRFYRTLTPPGSGELFVAGVDQVSKETGSGHDTWLTYAGPSQDFGNDCLVQVCRLQPTLDGVQQVDKFKARDQQLAIRALSTMTCSDRRLPTP